MATSTSCWPYLPSLKMVRSCRLRTMSWIYKESHGQAVSSSISSLLLPTGPCTVQGNSSVPSITCRAPVLCPPSWTGHKHSLSQREQAVEGQSLSP